MKKKPPKLQIPVTCMMCEQEKSVIGVEASGRYTVLCTGCYWIFELEVQELKDNANKFTVVAL